MPTGSIPVTGSEISLGRLSVAMGLFANTASITNCSLNSVVGANRNKLGSVAIQSRASGSGVDRRTTSFCTLTSLPTNTLLIVGTIGDGGNNTSEYSASITSNPSLTWRRASFGRGNPNSIANTEYWWATQSAGGSYGITASWSPATNSFGANWRVSSVYAYSIRGYSTVTPTGSVWSWSGGTAVQTISTGSITTVSPGFGLVIGGSGDYNAGAQTNTYTGSEHFRLDWKENTFQAANYIGWYYTDLVVTAGSLRIGVLTPTTLSATQVLLEARNGATGIPTSSQTFLSADFGGLTSSNVY